jgi:hypothetical protein
MQIIHVSNQKLANEFIDMQASIYAQDINWIKPWRHDIANIFDPKINKFYRHGACERWLLQKNNKTIGRIAAFINQRTAKESKVGGLGFFECIDDKEAANLLFETAQEWLTQKGMQAMEGPINFGERDKWWGLLVDGFSPPTYCMNYNKPYYKNLFEGYGFKTYFEQYVFNYEVSQPVPNKFGEKADRIARDPKYSFKHIRKNQLNQYAAYFYEVYNAAWGKHQGFKMMTMEQCKKLMQTIKPIMDEKLVWFGFYDNKPIAFFIMLPELNMAVKKLNGKFTWWHKLKLMYYLKMTKLVSKAYGVVFGVVPEFQGKGMEGGIVIAAEKVVRPLNKYTDIELTWMGSFNPKMIAICESLNAKKTKTLITYRYLFDQTAVFKPHPIIH